eukprot:scaffold83862_cov22-Tisochrysis_lutea.AAC.1
MQNSLDASAGDTGVSGARVSDASVRDADKRMAKINGAGFSDTNLCKPGESDIHASSILVVKCMVAMHPLTIKKQASCLFLYQHPGVVVICAQQ